jgi:hypothetical protein
MPPDPDPAASGSFRERLPTVPAAFRDDHHDLIHLLD